MNIFQFVCVKLTFFIVIGIIIGNYWGPSSGILLITTIISLSTLAILLYKGYQRDSFKFGIVTALCTICLGTLSVCLHNEFSYRHHFNAEETGRPRLWELQIREKLKSTDYYHRYIAQVVSVDNMASEGQILCRIPLEEGQLDFSIDDLLWTWSGLEGFSDPLNPYQFNYKKYLENKGVYHQIKLQEEHMLNHIPKTNTVFGIAEGIRKKIDIELENRDFGPEELSIIRALLLGQRNDISDLTYSHYKNSGAVHILAVSGLHIGIVLLLVQSLLRPLEFIKRGRLITMILTLLILWAYALLAGFSASIIRAVTMFSFLAYASFLNRPGSTFNILAISMSFILLVIDPLLLFQPSFQLSYAAVFSIIWLYPKLLNFWTPSVFITRKLWQLFAVGIAAQAGILPISLFYFHQFPGLFFITNITIVPFLGFILGFGFLIIILALFKILPDFMVVIYNEVIKTMNSAIRWISSQDSFLIENIYFDEVNLILCYCLLFALVVAFKKPDPGRIFVTACFVICIQIRDVISVTQAINKEQLTVMHLVGGSVLFHQQGKKLRILSNLKLRSERMVEDYKTNERISHIDYDSLYNAYQFGKKTLLILDQNTALKPKEFKPDILMLSNSPKLNLDRYLLENQPELVVADGSNYKSHLRRWQKSCRRLGIPFHSTAQEGALILSFAN